METDGLPLATVETMIVEMGWPSPRGLIMGLSSVLIGQLVVLVYYYLQRNVFKCRTIRTPAPPKQTLTSELWAHISAPESFFLVFGYLSVVWMLRVLPNSYYDLASPVNWLHVLSQFLVVDFWTYVDHRFEHYFMSYYRHSHKMHHKFNNPKLFNAFNGSVLDTFTLILLPLFLTAQICRFVTCWDFIAFGTLYASQFTLIHSEFPHPWDPLFALVGIGTAADHNIHHSTIKHNFGHFFVYFDQLWGTYLPGQVVDRRHRVWLACTVGVGCLAWWCFGRYATLAVFVVFWIYLWMRANTLQPNLRPPLKIDPSQIPLNYGKEATDLTKWHLTTDKGRHVWIYSEKQTPNLQNFPDRYFLGLNVEKDAPPLQKPNNAVEATRNGLKFYCKLPLEDGHWGNDYGGPLFLLPGFIFTCHITKTEIPTTHKTEMIRYLTNVQRSDGGWGLHIESPSTMFGTAMNYIAMRILGLSRTDPRMVHARSWLEANGGAVSVPAWGKFWLCVLGLYEWHGMNPVPPELWILPYWLPFHPGRWWCHTRVVYLPMAWLYGSRATSPCDALTKELREEIYVHTYDTIDWHAQCNNVMANDCYRGHSWLFDIAFGALAIYEKIAIPALRRYALGVTLDHIRYEDRETHGICIGPVNKALDMLTEYWASHGKSDLFKLHQDRVFDYMWLAADGMKFQGYNGSQLWDTAFSLQAILETGMGDEKEFSSTMANGYKYIDITQVRENNPQSKVYYRHISKGAWPFSTIDHGWPISDCTAEGFTCALLMPLKLDCCKSLAISSERLFDSVNVMLSYQNSDGGWPSYENQRGPAWLELLNPADCFDKIMVDYSYVECSAACIQALLRFTKVHHAHRRKEIDSAVTRGIKYLMKEQKPDGSWHGCWGVCYTYGGWFAMNALSMAKKSGLAINVETALEKGAKFLLDKQHADGSWGEDFRSCSDRKWVDLPQGHVVNTAWGLLSLMALDSPPKKAIEKGIKWLIDKQLPNGDWAQESISGVFNFNCAISYSGYKNIFPIWALGRYITTIKQ